MRAAASRVPATRSPGEVPASVGVACARVDIVRAMVGVARPDASSDPASRSGVGPRSVVIPDRAPVPGPPGRRQHCRHAPSHRAVRTVRRRLVDRDDGGTLTARRLAARHGARRGAAGAGAAGRRRPRTATSSTQGSCTGSTDWKLKLSEEDGRIEVEFEVDQNQNGHTWNVTLKRNGSVVWTGQRTTQGAERLVRGPQGHQRRGGRRQDRRPRHVPGSGEVCRGTATFSACWAVRTGAVGGMERSRRYDSDVLTDR